MFIILTIPLSVVLQVGGFFCIISTIEGVLLRGNQ
uniref:Uncharacterized protein n=1 Tax=Siphoviridae sp. ctpoI7 TaxID=2825678 RepID=A0A8S5PAW4_9CAUD|nr:MAG TPA: hypothetical protein [Siphoviridae sp. ctpoI7]